MKREIIKQTLKDILTEIEPTEEIDDNTDLLDGILDSMGVLFVLSEVMERLKIEIPMTEVTIENFSYIDKLADLVEKFDRG